LAVDIKGGSQNRIPLWLFGFLYWLDLSAENGKIFQCSIL
jgi:hypothetical protein